MRILSVDLAHTSYANLGIVTLEDDRKGFVAKPLAARDLGLTGQPSPQELAGNLAEMCQRIGASILLLDGPQAWKHPGNGLEHSRICERKLNTPGKTGLPGNAKPANYLPFIAFSIAVFEGLVERGFELFKDSITDRLALESFPSSAWKTLGVLPLPAKSKTKPGDLLRAASDLRRLFPIDFPEGLTHDEIQALVAAFAGVALARHNETGYKVSGLAPSQLEGTWREGFIVNPTPEALAP